MLNIYTLSASLLCRTRHAFLVFVVGFGTSIVAGTGLVSLALSPKAHADTALTLDAAIELAKQNDLWIEGSYHRENAKSVLMFNIFCPSSLQCMQTPSMSIKKVLMMSRVRRVRARLNAG